MKEKDEKERAAEYCSGITAEADDAREAPFERRIEKLMQIGFTEEMLDLFIPISLDAEIAESARACLFMGCSIDEVTKLIDNTEDLKSRARSLIAGKLSENDPIMIKLNKELEEAKLKHKTLERGMKKIQIEAARLQEEKEKIVSEREEAEKQLLEEKTALAQTRKENESLHTSIKEKDRKIEKAMKGPRFREIECFEIRPKVPKTLREKIDFILTGAYEPDIMPPVRKTIPVVPETGRASELIEFFTAQSLSGEQMEVLTKAFEDGLPIEAIKTLAKPDSTVKQIEMCRKIAYIEYGIPYVEDEEVTEPVKADITGSKKEIEPSDFKSEVEEKTLSAVADPKSKVSQLQTENEESYEMVVDADAPEDDVM